MSWLARVRSLIDKPIPTPKKEAPPVAVALTEPQFRALFPQASVSALDHLNRAMTRYKIDSPVRAAAFLAQIGHESAGLTAVVENLNYSAPGLAATWPNRYRGADGKPNQLALKLSRDREQIANHTYANRMGNGDPSTGDGWKYRGRGYIQTTGRANYEALTRALGINVLAVPDLLEQPEYAALSAAYFWQSKGLNELADANQFDLITRKINGGTNGAADRNARWEKAKRVLRGDL
ncbi:lytic enzyme [Pseudomonas phage Rollin]|nr:lytic enzyme [Pseudomonas phage Rollin]